MITIFYRGLKDNVKDELIRTGASIKDLEGLISEAISKDDMLYERILEKKYNSRNRGYLGLLDK